MDCEKVIVCDVDGVLTDGKVWVSSTGDKLKGFHTRDVRAIKELISHGYEVHLVTASSWPGIKDFAEKTGAEVHILRDKEQFKINEPFICIGDDAWDIKLFRKASTMYCPSDADLCVRVLPGMNVLKIKGGKGVMADIAKIILQDEIEGMLKDLETI